MYKALTVKVGSLVFLEKRNKFMNIRKTIEIVFWIQYPIYIEKHHFPDGGTIR